MSRIQITSKTPSWQTLRKQRYETASTSNYSPTFKTAGLGAHNMWIIVCNNSGKFEIICRLSMVLSSRGFESSFLRLPDNELWISSTLLIKESSA